MPIIRSSATRLAKLNVLHPGASPAICQQRIASNCRTVIAMGAGQSRLEETIAGQARSYRYRPPVGAGLPRDRLKDDT